MPSLPGSVVRTLVRDIGGEAVKQAEQAAKQITSGVAESALGIPSKTPPVKTSPKAPSRSPSLTKEIEQARRRRLSEVRQSIAQAQKKPPPAARQEARQPSPVSGPTSAQLLQQRKKGEFRGGN